MSSLAQQFEERVGLQTTKVNKQDLLTAVKKNRDKHKTDYDEAIAGWQTSMIEYAEGVIQATQDYKTDLQKVLYIEGSQLPHMDFPGLPPKPNSYLKSYDVAIRKLEMSIDTEVILEDVEFNNLVMDEWAWKGQFVNTSNMYKSAAVSLGGTRALLAGSGWTNNEFGEETAAGTVAPHAKTISKALKHMAKSVKPNTKKDKKKKK